MLREDLKFGTIYVYNGKEECIYQGMKKRFIRGTGWRSYFLFLGENGKRIELHSWDLVNLKEVYYDN